jgi:hypothetical protein
MPQQSHRRLTFQIRGYQGYVVGVHYAQVGSFRTSIVGDGLGFGDFIFSCNWNVIPNTTKIQQTGSMCIGQHRDGHMPNRRVQTAQDRPVNLARSWIDSSHRPGFRPAFAVQLLGNVIFLSVGNNCCTLSFVTMVIGNTIFFGGVFPAKASSSASTDFCPIR